MGDVGICSKCGRELPFGAFARNASKKLGRESRCKECAAVSSAAWRDDNRAHLAAQYQSHREKDAARHRKWLEANRAKWSAYCRDYHEANKDRAAAHAQANAGKRAAYQRNRKARELGNGGTHTAEDIQAQHDRQDGRCFWCKKKVVGDYHADHVIPLILEGSNGPENLVIACPTCNQSKGAKHPMDFAGILT